MKKPLAILALAAAPGLLLAPAARAADPERGRTLFAESCASCHGPGGRGDGPVGQALAAKGTPPRDFTSGDFKFDPDRDGVHGTDADLAAVIRNGTGPYGGSPLMAPWSHLGDAAIADLVAYIRTLRP
jgi:mono/diheme cytochrome c family protein